jgi:hypothetical protein
MLWGSWNHCSQVLNNKIYIGFKTEAFISGSCIIKLFNGRNLLSNLKVSVFKKAIEDADNNKDTSLLHYWIYYSCKEF